MHSLSRGSPLVITLLLLAACGDGASMAPSNAETPPPTTAPSSAGNDALDACTRDEFGCVVIADGDPILLGTALTLTGPLASLGLDSQYGAQVAVNLRGEVLDHEVEMVHQDDRCSSDGGTAAANLLRAIDGIVAVVGTSCSTAAVPAAELLSERGILLVSPSNTAPSLTDPASHQAFYARVAYNDEAQAAAMADFSCSELRVGTAATIHDGSEPAMRLEAVFVDAFEARCDGVVTARKAAQGDEADLAALLGEVAVSNGGGAPELLYFPIPTDRGAIITRQARATAGMEDTILAGVRAGLDGQLTGDFLATAGAAADGMYASGAALGVTGDFYETTFLEEYTNVSGLEAPISSFHPYAYDAVSLLLAAVESVGIQADGSLHVPRTLLRDALLSVEGYQGLTGRLNCGQDGDCASPTIVVWQVEAGAYRRVWP